MSSICRMIPEITNANPDEVQSLIANARQPLIFRGLVKHWPIVTAANTSFDALQKYLLNFYSGDPLITYYGEPNIRGKVFYAEDFSGFNYKVARVHLHEVLEKIALYSEQSESPVYYVGSTMVDRWFPGFRTDNNLSLEGINPLVSIWLGNQSVISTHFDFPQNIACNVVGKRRFTLFPPDQLENLYVGPLDITPSGRSISLVDLNDPDLEKYPRFSSALDSALSAELEVGDAIYIPSMWWHHVEGLKDFNVLVNYWWRDSPNIWGNPDYALQHAILSLRNLPEEQRKAWKNIFDYYVFGDSAEVDHIPEHARGILGEMTDELAKRIRSDLQKKLKF